MGDLLWKALIILFGITMIVVAIFVSISLIYYVSSPLISLVKDAIHDFRRRIDNKNGIDTDMYYDIIKVKNLATTRRKFPDYCFVCDAKTGNVYQITNGQRGDEVILNYYEDSISKCNQCGCPLKSRACSYCGSESPDYLDVEFISAVLTEYGFKVKGFFR